MAEFIGRMRHPVLRRVNGLDVVAIVDLFALSREYQLQFTDYGDHHLLDTNGYPNVHCSMLVDIHKDNWNYISDTVFLLSMLTNTSCIDIKLYASTQATSLVIFAVDKDFAISGMLTSPERCISVTVTEDPSHCGVLYHNILPLCTKERLLFRKSTMAALLESQDYQRGLLSMNPRWLLGHLTEHFLSDDLFEELVEQLRQTEPARTSLDQLRSIHRAAHHIVKGSALQLLLYESALFDFLVSGTLDFYNHPIKLTKSQQLRYLEHLDELVHSNPLLDIRMICQPLVPDMAYNSRQCLFLNDAAPYIRLDSPCNNLLLIDQRDMQKIFDESFQAFWNCDPGLVLADKVDILPHIEHVQQSIRLSLGANSDDVSADSL